MIAGAFTFLPGRPARWRLLIGGSANAGAGIEAVMISGANAAEALTPGLLARAPDARQAFQAAPKGGFDAVQQLIEKAG